MFKGWRTRLFSIAIMVLGVVEMIDPGLVTTAFGLGPQANAILLIVIAVVSFILRQITTSPPPPLTGKK